MRKIDVMDGYAHLMCANPKCLKLESVPVDDPNPKYELFTHEWLSSEYDIRNGKNWISNSKCNTCGHTEMIEWDYDNVVEEED